MNLSDIIALAKAGYSVKDVRELLAIETPAPTAPVEKAEEITPEPAQENNDVESPIESAPLENEPDYKSMYEKTLADLKKAQQANTRIDMTDKNQPSDQDRIRDLISSFI